MSEKITWTNEQRKLSELIPWELNPATIDKDEARRLEESLDEFGQVETIAISPANEIYDGHQRQVVWGASKQFGPDYIVDVRVSSRQLTERERKKLVILLRKGAVGHFDWDMLANNWENEDLLEWGFKPYELGLSIDPNNPNEEWVGMPEFDIQNKAIRTLMVHFETQQDVKDFLEAINQSITEDTKYIWYPPKKPAKKSDLVYINES